MRIFTKLLRTCSRASVGYVIPVRNISKVLINNSYFSTRNMAQKSITSFFTVTPKKPAPVKEEIGQNNIKEETSPVTNEKEKQKSSKRQRLDSSKSEPSKSPEKPPASNSKKAPEKIKEETSPVTNGMEKRSSKRQRLDSSESEPSKSPEKSPASDTEKKKKSKRQRIESSGSEAESPKSEPSSPKLKVEKNEAPPKTYQTPKSKKSKAGKTASPLSETNGKVKKKVSPKRTVAVKKEVVTPSIKTEKDAKKKETSPVGVKEKEDTEKKDASDNEKIPKVLDTEYSPAKSKYHPINDACWAKGEAVPYLALAKTLEAIEATSARLKMIEILSNYLRSVIALTPEDLLPSVYMCLNQLAPAYHSLELGIAETYLMKAVGQCTGRTVAQLKAATAKDGDLGAVAARARATQRTMFTQPPLLARRVFAALREVARMTGHASVNKKIAKIQSLFTACRNCEAKYLVRSLEGKLRIGLAEQSVLQALALAATTTPPNPRGVDVLDASKGVPADQFKARVDANALIIKTTYCECPNYDALIPVLLEHGVAALPQHCKLTPGVPLKPMLAHPARGVGELFTRFEGSDFTCEWKYDGERAQIHVPAAADGTADVGKATLYSRNQENNTTKYPDVIGRLSSLLKEGVSSCVLDCEAVAYDTDKKQILPFQILSTRKRKDANESEIKVQVCVFIFDLLYLDGQAMVGRPLAERRELLHEKFNQVPGWWEFATFRDCSSTEEVQEVLQEAVKGSCEGLMVKALRGPRAYYDIARRSHNWLKLKKDYLDGVGDTVDVVVLGGYFGRGKRAGHYGGFLLFCRDGDQYQSLCKIGTGFSDEQLTQFSDELNKHVIDAPRSYYRFDKSHSPDAWFSAAIVWEVRCADLSLSPAHHAAIGLVDKEKGISLRFPRFVRVRDDKTPEQATSAEQIAQLYLNQDQIKNHAPAATLPEDDFY